MTINQVVPPPGSDALLAAKDAVIESQHRELALYREKCENYRTQIGHLQRQCERASVVIDSLNYVFARLDLAREKCRQELRAFGTRPDILDPPERAARWQRDERLLADIEKLLEEVETELRRAERGVARARRLDSLFQVDLETTQPGQPLPEDVAPVAVPLPQPARTSIGDDELLDRSRSLVSRSHTENDEIEQELDRIAGELPPALATRTSIAASPAEAPRPTTHRAAALREHQPETDERDHQINKLQRKVDDLQRKVAGEDARTGPTDILAGVLALALVLLLPCAMLATGVLIHAAPRFPAASSTEHTIVLGLAAILFGIPIVWLYNWSKQTSGHVTLAAAALWIGGVVAGYFSAVVALVAAAVMFALVASARKIGVGAVVVAGLTLLLWVLAPGFLWWSWTTLDGLRALF